MEVCSLHENFTRYYTLRRNAMSNNCKQCIYNPPNGTYAIYALDVGRNYAVVRQYNITDNNTSRKIL